MSRDCDPSNRLSVIAFSRWFVNTLLWRRLKHVPKGYRGKKKNRDFLVKKQAVELTNSLMELSLEERKTALEQMRKEATP